MKDTFVKRALLIAVLLLCGQAAFGQGTATTLRTVGSLPATCTPGSATLATPVVMYMGQLEYCSGTNTWSVISGGGSISGLTTGYVPKAASATTVANSLCDEGITTANTLTCTNSAGAKFSGPVTAGNSGGAGGANDLPEGTAASAAASHDICYADSTLHAVKCSWNNGTFFALEQIVGQGTISLSSGTLGTISANTCSSAITTAVTGAATTDSARVNFSADPTGTTGYLPSAMLTIVPYLTSGNINVKVCNVTGSSIAPTTITLQYRVSRGG